MLKKTPRVIRCELLAVSPMLRSERGQWTLDSLEAGTSAIVPVARRRLHVVWWGFIFRCLLDRSHASGVRARRIFAEALSLLLSYWM